MAGTKRTKSYFFAVTSSVRLDGTTGGTRFRNTDKPPMQTFEDLCASATFFTESSDRARISTGATLGSEQGLVVLASDVQAKANTAQLADRSLVVQPHQLPTAEATTNSAVEDMPTTPLQVQVGAASTRNQYTFRLSATWITWLVSRLFEAGGVAGDVMIKQSGTDYDKAWGNLGNNATTVTNIANNATFVSTLLANTTFVNSIITQAITNNAAVITEALEVGFMRIHPVTAMPSAKWLRCDGSAISRTTYSTLFALVGTTYGVGDGVTTFNIPDLRDKQVTGYSGTKAIGSTSGTETHTIASANLPTHTHSGTSLVVDDDTHKHNFTEVDNTGVIDTDSMIESLSLAYAAGAGAATYLSPTVVSSGTALNHSIGMANDTHNHNITGDTGNGGFANTAINHLDPYVACNFIIKVTA